MGYAPYTRVVTAPNPENAGTAFTVMQDTGDRFPATPFKALVWADQSLPDFGVNAEELTILTTDGDAFTCQRGTPAISIASNSQLALLYDQDRFDVYETALLLSDEFPVTDTGIELLVRDSQGSVSLYSLADGLAALAGSGGGSAFSHSFAPARSGQWHYRFESDQRAQPEREFFVRFSDVS